GPNPSLSITPGRKPSISASAWPRSSSALATEALSFKSSSTTLRPRPAIDLRFFLAPMRSSVTSSAPISASSMQANGPGPMPANSTMRTPASGPLAYWVESLIWEEAIVSLTSKLQLLLYPCLGIVAQWIAQGHLCSVGPQPG